MTQIIPNTKAVPQIIGSSPVVINGSNHNWIPSEIMHGVKAIHVGDYSFSAEETGGVAAELKITLQRDLGSGWEDQPGEVSGLTFTAGQDRRFRVLCKVPYYEGIEAGVLPKYRLLAECSTGEVTLHSAEGSEGVPSGQWKAEYEFEGEVSVEIIGYISQTGITGCYDSSGAVISCIGSGQDGEYQEGVELPQPRFVDNGDGTLTDLLTGLVWSQNANIGNAKQTWDNALSLANNAEDGLHGITDGSSAGDWRLPNHNELRSLLNMSIHSPAITNIEGDAPNGASGTQSFSDLANDEYWTSTTDNSLKDFARTINLGYCTQNRDPKTQSKYVLIVKGTCSGPLMLSQTGITGCYDSSGAVISCIGSGQDGEYQEGVELPQPRFVDNGDGTLTDLLTGLVWSQNANQLNGEVNWQAALDEANSTPGWRLPTINELLSVIDCGKSLPCVDNDNSAISDLRADFAYWSSTTYAVEALRGYAWSLGLGYGTTTAASKNNVAWVWLVKK